MFSDPSVDYNPKRSTLWQTWGTKRIMGVIEKDSKGARKDNVGFRVGNNMSKDNNNNNIFYNI
jgi:hypothetical protein